MLRTFQMPLVHVATLLTNPTSTTFVDIGALWRENMALVYENNEDVDHPAHPLSLTSKLYWHILLHAKFH